MNIIIDSRMRWKEKEYLKQFGNILKLSLQNSVYDEVSGHPDIFLAKIEDVMFQSPNLQIDNLFFDKLYLGEENVGAVYPSDVKYNVCQIGKNIVHDFRYTDKAILRYISDKKLNKIQVNQGYANCSISVISDTACITSDRGIYKELVKQNLEVLFIEEKNIRLLDREGNKTKMKGFIGGATAIIGNKFILFGDSDYLENKNVILEYLNKNGLELVDFKDLEIYDYGGIITFE